MTQEREDKEYTITFTEIQMMKVKLRVVDQIMWNMHDALSTTTPSRLAAGEFFSESLAQINDMLLSLEDLPF